MWEIEYTDEFGEWWDTLSEEEQKRVSFDDRFYDVMIPRADKIYDEYLKEIQEEKHENP